MQNDGLITALDTSRLRVGYHNSLKLQHRMITKDFNVLVDFVSDCRNVLVEIFIKDKEKRNRGRNVLALYR